MAEDIVKAQMTDKAVDAVIVPIVKMEESVQTYTLEDGTVLRLRLAMIQVARVKGDYDKDNNPVYIMKHQVVATVTAPEALKKKKPQ